MVLRLERSVLADAGRSLRSGLWINRGSTIKAQARGRGLLEGYLVSWGSPEDADLEGQYFTPATVFREDYYSDYPMLYHHGLDEVVGLNPIGRIKTLQKDDVGLWVQAQLDMADKYAREIYDMVQARQFGWSSGAVDHLVKIAPSGEIEQWVLFEGSVTPTPAQPHKTAVRAVKSAFGKDDPIIAYLTRTQQDVQHEEGRRETVDVQQAAREAVLAALHKRGHRLSAKEVEEIAGEVQAKMKQLQQDDEARMPKQDDEALMSELDDEVLMSELDDEALMSELDDEALMSELDDEVLMSELDDEALMSELDDEALMSELDDEALMSEPDDEALMSELDDEALMSEPDDEAVQPAKRRRKALRAKPRAHQKRARRKALSAQYMRWLERRVKALERLEAPGERTIGMKALRVTDAADRKGAYKSAFELYVRRGEMALSETERYILNSRRVVDHGTPGYVDARIKTLNVTQGGSVGFAVPPEFLNELNRNISVNAAMYSEARKQTTSSDTIVIPDLVTSDARRAFPGSVNWVGESPANQAASQITDITLGQINLPIFVALVSTTATYSALEDASFDLSATIAEQFAEALWTQYETLIWSGDGQNKLRGIVTDSRVTGAQSTGVSSVGGYVNSGSATTITSGDPLKTMQMHLPPQYRSRAKWYANSATINIISQLKDGMGRYLWSDNGGLNNGIPTVLLGSPIVYNEFADDVAAGAFPLIYGSMSDLYMVGQRVEFSLRRFDDSSYAVRDQVLFIGRARVGGMVVKPYAAKVLRIAAS